MKIVGEIDSSTAEKVKSLLDEVHARAIHEKKTANLVLETVELNSSGGTVPAAMAIGRMLRKERMLVVVPNWGVCYSACVLIFAGGASRMNAGKLGIHRPYFQAPEQAVSSEGVTDSYRKMLDEIRSYFREMNVSEQLADDMLRIEPDAILLLDDSALNSYGLTPTDPIEQETEDLEEAQSWGISRKELIERRSLAAKVCPGHFGVPDSLSACYRTLMKTGQVPAQPDFSQYGIPAR